LQQSSQSGLNKIHTRTITSQRSGKGTALDPLLAFTAREAQRDGLHAHVLPRHAKGIRQGLACWSVLKLHKNGITGKPWRIIHELYANSASTPIIEGQTTELYRIRRRCSGLPHVTYTVQRVH
jgi:NADPH-dependent 7-cyano-7-deazaguanine reductase QueF-like protein